MMRTARKQTIPNKLYFRIGEVSDIVGVKPYVLRYWETEFGDVRPTKSKSGQRLYKRRDVELLMSVKTLLYEERYTIDGAKQRLRETARGDAPTTMPSAVTHASQLAALEEQLSLPTTPAAVEPRSNGHGAAATVTDDDVEETVAHAHAETMQSLPILGTRRVRETLASRRLLLKLREGLQDVLTELQG